jgi:hypothetical protein
LQHMGVPVAVSRIVCGSPADCRKVGWSGDLAMTIVRWNCRSPLPVKKTLVRVTALGARYFELLRSGYSEPEALSIATSEHGPKLADAPPAG